MMCWRSTDHTRNKVGLTDGETNEVRTLRTSGPAKECGLHPLADGEDLNQGNELARSSDGVAVSGESSG